jgi:protein-S-isoprenylcysteine O-methyltransferase Ste14
MINVTDVAFKGAGLALLSLWFIVDQRLLARRPHDRAIRCEPRSCRILVLANMIGLVLALLAAVSFSRGRMPDDDPLAIWGLGCMLIGISIRLSAMTTLGRFHMTTVSILPDHRLVERGFYRWIRHPSYLGVIVLLLGLACVLANYASLCILLGFVIPAYAYRISREEKILIERFGQVYENYRLRTRRLVPFIY